MQIPETPDVLNWGDQVGGQLRAALQARQAKQLMEAELKRKAEQEQYERGETEKENQRKQQADAWELEDRKLKHKQMGLDIKNLEFKQQTDEARLRLDAAAQTAQPTFADSQGAVPEPGKAPMMTPDTPEERASFAAAPPEQVTIPADVTPSGQAINMPVQYKEQVEAERQKKQAEAIALYTAKQKAELANSETVAAAIARAAAAAAAADAKKDAPVAPKPLLQGEANKVTELRQGLTQLEKLEANIGETGLLSGFRAAVPGGGNILGAEEKKRLAAIKLAKQLIGKALEGGVLRKEDEAKYEQILPTMWDKPDVAAAKIKQLRTTLGDNYEEMLRSLEDNGRDVSRFRARDAGGKPAASGGNVISYDAQGNRIK